VATNDPADGLSTNAWAVLTLLVDDGPRHGFALAHELRRGGDIGRAWAVSRPLVYRALDQLEARGLVRAGPEEQSPAGPARREYRATPAGRRAADRWRHTPVDHLRDVRPDLILKLTLNRRAGLDPAPLVAAQRDAFTSVLAEVADPDLSPENPRLVVDVWREELARAVDRTLSRVRDAGPS